MDNTPRRTLASRLEDRDRSRFTGRSGEVAFLNQCLDSTDPPASVVHVCGPGGIGKSTHSYELMTALDSYLRRDLLPELPDEAMVIIAGRGDPDPGWFSGGWEAVTARLDLSALAPDDARRLLAARGLTDQRVPAIIDWAAGSPLALALAAEAAIADPGWNASSAADRPDILHALLYRLVETELQDVQPSALGIAVVARTTTPELVRAVLPGDDADAEYRQLAGLTITDRIGSGITMHELARRALLADMRQRNPELERDLRRRIVDHLYSRAQSGEVQLMIDMAHLVENPLVRWGFGWHGNASFRVDSVRPGDEAWISQVMTEYDAPWWQLTRRFFAEAPDRVAVARDLSDQICGYLVSMSQLTAPPFADQDPLTGPWLGRARCDAGLGDSVLWHAAVDFTGQGTVQAMLGVAGVLRNGTPSARFAYLPIDPRVPGALDFARAVGAQHLAELDARIGNRVVQCHRLDYGPGGMFAYIRAQIYAEIGLPAPAQPERLVADAAAVRQALRDFRVPRELARSPLATGSTVAERAEYVRNLLRTAAEQAFGDSESEKLLYGVLMTGYLEPLRSHEEAASKLCLSRAAYFRRLKTAVERLAEHISADPQSPTAAVSRGRPEPRP